MTIPTAPRTSSLYHASELAAGSVFSAGHAIAVLLATFGVYLATVVILGAAKLDLLLVVLVGEVALFSVPAVFARVRRGGPAMLGLRRPEMRFVVAALLLGSSQWFLNLLAVDALDRWIDLSNNSGIDRLQKVAVDPPLALSLIAIALAPAIGEEILFRGVLARGLATRFVPAVAILGSAALFSLFHLSLVQALPTFLLGLVYGYLALASRSVIPTMIAHFINNSFAILVAQGAVPWLASAIGANTIVSAGVALAMTTSGIVLALRSRS